MSHGRLARRPPTALVRSGLILVVFLAASRFGSAQERLPAGESAPPAASQPAVPPEVLPLPSEGDPPDASGKPAAEKPKPFWTTVPPLSPYPRLGFPFVFPTGPGHYSLLDVVENNYRDKAPKSPYPPISPDPFPFFDADFRYLDDPNNQQHDWLDPVKRIHIGDRWLLSFGGEERFQYKDETANGERLNGLNNKYQLNRVRLYGDLWYCDLFRVYVEYIDAQSYNQDLPPLAIDVNHSDLLNLFTDLKLFNIDDNGFYARVGRQELVYGSQRLISPLDWANTRRTFEGVKGFWHSEKLDVDAFWVKPVLISPSHFDAGDANRGFAGLWTTYRPRTGTIIDAYYLYLDQHSPVPGAIPPGGRGGFNVNTIGGRYFGTFHNNFYVDVEGMWQFGDITTQSISAGAATAGIGYRFADCPMTPTLWIYNDYASGDDKGGRGGTFNQLFPFGHYYFGFIDAVGRQNIEDFNMHLQFYPTKWITTALAGHFFYLDSGKDALYNAAGAATRKDPTGGSGLHVGDEIDFTTNFHLTMHQDVLVGFSQLFAGEFIRKTGSPRSPELFYLQYSYKW